MSFFSDPQSYHFSSLFYQMICYVILKIISHDTSRQLILGCDLVAAFWDRSRIAGKGIHRYKGVGVCFADFISVFLNIP